LCQQQSDLWENLCWTTKTNIADLNVFDSINGRANLLKAWLQPQAHRQIGNYVQLLWDPDKLSEALRGLNWRTNFPSNFTESHRDIIQHPGLLVTGIFSLWPDDFARFRRRIIISQIAYNRFPNYFPEPYGCLEIALEGSLTANIIVFAIKSPLATMTQSCISTEYLCFFHAMKNPLVDGRRISDETNLTHKKRLSILKSIADAVAALHSMGLTYNKLSFETIGIQDMFADKIKLYDFELVTYQGDKVYGINPDYADMEGLMAYQEVEVNGSMAKGFDIASYEADVWSFGIMIWEFLSNDRDSETIRVGNLWGTAEQRSEFKRQEIMERVYTSKAFNSCYKFGNTCVCFMDLMNKMLQLRRVDRLQNFNLISVALKIMLAGQVISREVTASFLFSLGLYCSKVI
jgi:serine/threonine protein kinase